MDKTRNMVLLAAVLLIAGLVGFYTLYLGQPLTLGLLVIAAFGLALAFIDTSFGMGFGTLGTPILLIIGLSSKLAVPSILIAQAVSAFFGFVLHQKYKNVNLWRIDGSDARIAMVLVAMGIAGTVVAVFVALSVPKMYINTYIGVLIVAMGAIMALNSKTVFSWAKIGVIGLISGFNKAISGGGYGPVATTGLIVSGHPIKNSVGIALFTVSVINIVAFALYLMSKSITNFGLPVFLIIGALIGSQLGPRATKRLSGRKAKIAFAVVVVILGVLTVLTAWYQMPALIKLG